MMCFWIVNVTLTFSDRGSVELRLVYLCERKGLPSLDEQLPGRALKKIRAKT